MLLVTGRQEATRRWRSASSRRRQLGRRLALLQPLRSVPASRRGISQLLRKAFRQHPFGDLCLAKND